MTLHHAPNVRNGLSTEAPSDDFTTEQWHQAAIDDTGFSHNLPGRLYIVQCEWCPEAFAAKTKAEALAMFRVHEQQMLDAVPDTTNHESED